MKTSFLYASAITKAFRLEGVQRSSFSVLQSLWIMTLPLWEYPI
jgi:hypothetical protein